nr:hypothetical protein [Tanacetum cinerariifolium]
MTSLDDAEGVVCLPNKDIFAGLAQMGYEKPSTKLTYYKAFFSSQWKFLIHILLQSLSAKRTSWNEFNSAMAFAGLRHLYFRVCLLLEKFAEEGIAEDQVQADNAVVAAAVQETVVEDVANKVIPSTPTPLILPSPPSHDIPSTSQKLEIIKLKARVKRLERANKVKSSKLRRLKKVVFNQGRMIDDLDKDEGIELVVDQKSDVAEDFEQIIDFLNGCYIHYALTVNPHIYVSCIKKFWNTASVKRSDDVTRLQALVDMKKIVISEDVIREILQLDDAEGVESVADDVAENVANEAIPSTPTPLILPSPPSHDIPSTTQVQSSPLHQPQSSPQAPPQGAEFPIHLFQQVLDTCSALTRRVETLEHDKAAQMLEIIKLKTRVKRLERANKVKTSKLRRLKKVGTSQRVVSSNDMEDVFNQGRMIDDLDKDERIELVVDQVKDADIAKTEGRHAANQAEKQAKIYHLDLDHPSKVLISAASATISAAKLSIPDAASTEYARKLHEEINKDHEEINKDIDWDAAIDHSIEEMEKEDQEVLKSINETPAQKAAKRRKLNEEAQEAKDLKKHLEVTTGEANTIFDEELFLDEATSEARSSEADEEDVSLEQALVQDITFR